MQRPNIIVICISLTLLCFVFSCTKDPVDYSKDINDLKALVTELQHRSDSLATALGNTNTNLSNLSKSVDSIKLKLTDIQKQIDALTLSLTTANANIAAINEQLILLNQQYASLLEQLIAILAQLNAAPPTLSDGLVAYYPFSGNAGDSSGNGNHGNVNGATLTTDRFGDINQAYNFNGISNYIGCSSNNLPVSNRSISVWFYANSLNGGPAILGYGGNTCGSSFFIAINQPPIPDKIINQGHCIVDSLTTSYKTSLINAWFNLVITSDNSGTKHYLNGVLTSSNNTSLSNTYTFNKDFAIGVNVGSDGVMPWTDSNQTWWNGKLDDIRVYNRALNQSEISYLASH